MSLDTFLPPDALVAHVYQAVAPSRYTVMSTLLLGTPPPSLPRTNGTLSQPLVDSLIQLIDTHYQNARSLADRWMNSDPATGQMSVSDAALDVFDEFGSFQERFADAYATLIGAAYQADEPTVTHALGQIQALTDPALSRTLGASTAVQDYMSDWATVQHQFEQDHDRIVAEITTVSSTLSSLRSQVSALRAQVAANDKAVMKAAVGIGEAAIVQGAAVFGSKAEMKSSVSAGVQLGLAVERGEVSMIELEAATIACLDKIRTLSVQIDEDEVVLVALGNIGTVLDTLGGTQEPGLALISDLRSYWTQLSDGVGALLELDGPVSPHIDTTNYSPTTVDRRNPAFPPWNVTLPLATAADVFQRVRSITTASIDDETQFRPLSTT